MRFLILYSLFILFLSACSSEYFEHIARQKSIIETQSGTISSLKGELSVLPDKKVLDQLVASLDDAKTRIWVETYTWTEKSTQEALIRAKNRGVDVRIILEGNVYKTPWINNDVVKKIKNASIPFSYADNKNYTFTHIKTWIIDNRWCVSTGNWSFSSFTKNREFIYCSMDQSILGDLEELFLSDFRHVRPYFPDGMDARIGLAPENIRPWIMSNLANAKKSIIIYNQSVTDRAMLDFLRDVSEKGIHIEICRAESSDMLDETIVSKKNNIRYYTSKKPYLHAKVFIIDDRDIILGSANMTENALSNNREILLLLPNFVPGVEKILFFYHKDCHSSS